MTAPQPGWYPNPDGSADLRYWDGQTWTEHRREAPTGVYETEQSISFPPVAPPEATPVNETIQFTDSPPEQVADQNETMQFPPAPPEPELSATDTMVFPDAGSPSSTVPPPPVAPPPPAPTPPPVAPPAPAAEAPPIPPPPPGALPPLPPEPPVQGGFAAPGAVDVPAGFPAGPAPSYYPPAATQPVVSSGTNGVAVAALILGIIAAVLSALCGFVFFLSVPLGIVAIILGIVGMNQANKSDPPGPKGMAVAGLVLGIIAIVVSAGWFLLFLIGGAASSTSGF